MTTHYTAAGKFIVLVHSDGDERKAAQCGSIAEAVQAAKLLNDAKHLNDVKRRYTDAARKIAKAEALPGFRWTPDEPTTSAAVDTVDNA